ncbi:hypothetical protein [Massilia oculi]|uniref:hypothetical protein n=1 Tax=Massilia oculi TaxID=945844 RepID=UPI001AAF193B|nr:hypothetical protein [Massilia oculi]
MTFTNSPSLSSVNYVLKFSTLDRSVRFKQAQVEAAFSGFFKGQSQQTNVPDTVDPNQPRIVFGDETKTLAVSQVGCQLSMSFSESDISIARQLEVSKKNVIEFCDRANRAFGDVITSQSGLVMEITFPSKASSQELHQYIAEKFYSGPKVGEVASSNVTIGFKIKDLFLNFTAGVFEIRRFEFQTPQALANTYIDVESMPVTEHGLAFKIDVNDRPRQQLNGPNLTPPIELIQVIDDFIKNDFSNFSGLKLTEN